MTSGGKDQQESVVRTNVTCEFEYDGYSPNDERLATLQKSRSLFEKSDLSIFTSEIRLGIVLMLMKIESACVCEIQYALDESRQSLVSHHLRALKDAGWLHSEKWKKWIFYSLLPEKKKSVKLLIQGFAQ